MLWPKTSGVFSVPQFQQSYNIISLVTNTSVWEGDMSMSLHEQTCHDAENSRSFTLLLALELSQHVQYQLRLHTSV